MSFVMSFFLFRVVSLVRCYLLTSLLITLLSNYINLIEHTFLLVALLEIAAALWLYISD
jgi:hypothetical protein